MRVFVAGATGAIGRPLVRLLVAASHEAIGLASSDRSLRTLRELGADGIIADALDAEAVKTALGKVRPDAVIEELTALPKRGRIAWRSVGTAAPTAAKEDEEIKEAAARDHKVRIEGGRNVYNAARAAGTKRYIVQSTGFFYERGPGLAEEADPLAINASSSIAAGAKTYTQIEERVFGDGLEGVALRYGFFYGPGTWFTEDGDIANDLRKQKYPVVGSGKGVWSWVHVEDAAAATVDALDCRPGIYNVVDDNPAEFSVWLPALARSIAAPEPPQLSEGDALPRFGQDYVYYATQLRGASNAKAKRELGFAPRALEWLKQAT